MRRFLLICIFAWGVGNANLHAEENIYVEAFAHFIDSILVNSHSYVEGDTICIKEAFGITDKFPSVIKGYHIRIINEFNHGRIPNIKKVTNRYISQVYFIYPMRVRCNYPKEKDLTLDVGIHDGLILDQDGKLIRNARSVYRFEFNYCKEDGTIHFWRVNGGYYNGPCPWLK